MKNLLLEYDKQSEQLDIEKERANNFEHHVEDLTRQLRNSSLQVTLNWVNADMKIVITYISISIFLHEIKLIHGKKFNFIFFSHCWEKNITKQLATILSYLLL